MKLAGFSLLLFLTLSVEINYIIGDPNFDENSTVNQFAVNTTTTRYINNTTTKYTNVTTTTTRYGNNTTTTRYQPTTTTTRYQPTTRYVTNTTTTRPNVITTTTRPINITSTTPVFNFTTITMQPTVVPASIQCNYFSSSTIYGCDLKIYNPDGQEFSVIYGAHLPQKFDIDVFEVSGKFQNTKNIPSIICRKYINLKTLDIFWSEVSILTSESFKNCNNLETLDLKGNILTKIPFGTFGYHYKLRMINLERNQIEIIEDSVFHGIKLFELNLGYNELRMVNSTWFYRNSGYLRKLLVPGNRITKMIRTDYGMFGSIEYLDMSMNPIKNIQIIDFNMMSNVETLKLDDCEISELYLGNFNLLVNLKSLSINNNLIREFPSETFSYQPYLTDVSASGNRITSIDSRSFGNTMPRLRSLYIQNNQIDSIDPEFFNNTKDLSALFLDGNMCINRSFIIETLNRENVRQEIEPCFRNFRYVRCSYSGSPDFICQMSVRNLVGVDDIEIVEGQHPSGSNNNDVKIVNIINGTSTIFPSVICKQFNNLQEITASGNGITSLTTSAFQNCRNLKVLQLISQEISVIPENTFANLSNLQTLSLMLNKIQTISSRSMIGLSANMQNLYLNSNLITRIENGAFTSLANVSRIHLNSNRLTAVNSLSFGASLRHLTEFSANYNQINEIDPIWFNNSTVLDTLNLTGNVCVNASFVNVRSTRTYVSSQLQNCFNRFRT
ncbi:hypothetical protein ACKWTF_016537 [Chironomus riparius]